MSLQDLPASVLAYKRKLEDQGLFFSEFERVLEKDHKPVDIDWNYKDVIHHDFVHSDVTKNTVIWLRDDGCVTAWNISLFGFKIPLMQVSYSLGDYGVVSVCMQLGLALIVVNTWESQGEGSRVTTRYVLGSSKYLKFLHRFVFKVLSKNYDTLMAGDIPMRDRRLQLRRWGYTFSQDTQSSLSFKESSILSKKNVIVPERRESFDFSVNPRKFDVGKPYYFGRSDSRGFRLTRIQPDSLVVHPRSCDHEGACLDSSGMENCRLKCPWHGKEIKELGRVKLGNGENQAIQIESGQLMYDGNDTFKLQENPA